MELTLHTGFMGDGATIYIDWSDQNNKRLTDTLEISVREQDKPRVIDIYVNGVKVAELDSRMRLE
jgi:hypothetical protein